MRSLIYTSEEDQYIIDNYRVMGPHKVAENLSKTYEQVRKRAAMLGVTWRFKEHPTDPSLYLGKLCPKLHYFNDMQASERRKSCNACIHCLRLASNLWSKNNPEKKREYQKKYKYDSVHRALYEIKSRCKKRSINFDLDEDYIKNLWHEQDGKCYWTQIPLVFTNARYEPNKPTIDRLVPELGYIKNNVVWSSCFANYGRSNYPVEQYRDFLSTLGFHSGYGEYRIGNTRVFNVALLDESYNIVNKPTEVEL